jgi:HSP20 family protein
MNLRALVPFRSRSGLAPFEPGVFGTLHREIDRLFDELTNSAGMPGSGGVTSLLPSIDVNENDNEISVTVEMPGLERKDVDISLENDILTIRGEKKMEAEKDDKNRNVHLAERTYGVFYRALQLPPGIDPSSVQATMQNGVLRITIPKPPRSQAKKIEVKDQAQDPGKQQNQSKEKGKEQQAA